jgi:hypothetical protein
MEPSSYGASANLGGEEGTRAAQGGLVLTFTFDFEELASDGAAAHFFDQGDAGEDLYVKER